MEWIPMKWAIIIGVAIVITLYFVPTIMANENAKRNKLYILILNLALGWTVIGWVVALIWAIRKDKPGEEGTKWKWLAND
jgi:nicotinamide riboside transporter PnuC